MKLDLKSLSVSAKNQLKPKVILTEFKKIMVETSKIYNKKPHLITTHEFFFTSQGRIGRGLVDKCGGFAKLKAYLFPTPEAKLDKANKQLLERILGL